MRNRVVICLPWAAACERLVNSTFEATLEDAGWQRLRGLRAATLKEQKSASVSVFRRVPALGDPGYVVFGKSEFYNL